MADKANRILFMGALPPLPGGGSISREALLDGFVRAGREVVAICPILPEHLAEGDRFAAENPGIRVVRYGVSRYSRAYPPAVGDALDSWWREMEAIKRLSASLAQSFRPDVYLSGREDLAATVAGVAAAWQAPAVTMVRGAPTTQFLQGTYEPEWAARLAEAFGRVEAIVTVAEHLAEGLRKKGYEHVRTAHNSVSSALFHPRRRDDELLARLGIPVDRPILLYTGRVTSNKRPLDIVEAAAKARDQGVAATLVFCGDGPLADDCRRAAEASGAPLRITGWLDQDDVAKLTASVDVAVLASNGEGTSRALLEAMSCERCVLASDIPGVHEVVRDDENGLVFRLGDTDSLAGKLVQALGSAELRQRLGRAARRSLAWRRTERAVEVHLEALDDAVRRHVARQVKNDRQGVA